MADVRIKIPAELFAIAESSRFDGTFDVDVLEAGPDDYTFQEPVEWFVDVSNTGSALLVAGKATGVGSCACARCLSDVSYEFDGDIEGYFLVNPDEGWEDDGEEELGDDEFDVLPEDHIIDLEPLIRAALIVDAPEQPLCREDCKGICPMCGQDLNEGTCDCGRGAGLEEFDRAANPFAALADYKFEE